jgi:hypothetical protein
VFCWDFLNLSEIWARGILLVLVPVTVLALRAPTEIKNEDEFDGWSSRGVEAGSGSGTSV